MCLCFDRCSPPERACASGLWDPANCVCVSADTINYPEREAGKHAWVMLVKLVIFYSCWCIFSLVHQWFSSMWLTPTIDKTDNYSFSTDVVQMANLELVPPFCTEKRLAPEPRRPLPQLLLMTQHNNWFSILLSPWYSKGTNTEWDLHWYQNYNGGKRVIEE